MTDKHGLDRRFWKFREACVRYSFLRPDPAQRAPLVEIRDNPMARRITEAEREGWLGEIASLQFGLAGAEDELADSEAELAQMGNFHPSLFLCDCGSYSANMDWGTIVGTVTGAVIGVGATSLVDRSRWRREQAARQTAIKRELYAAYLAAVAQAWNEIRAAVIDSDEAWPERARLASLAYRNGGVYELRYQISITAPPNLVGLSDETMRGMRDLTNRLNAGQTYSSWDELKSDNQAWFDAFNTMRRMMRLDLDPEALHLPPSSH